MQASSQPRSPAPRRAKTAVKQKRQTPAGAAAAAASSSAALQPVSVKPKKPKKPSPPKPVSAPLRVSSVHPAAAASARQDRVAFAVGHRPKDQEEKGDDDEEMGEMASQSTVPQERREASQLRKDVDLVKHNQWLPPVDAVAAVEQRRKLRHIDDLDDNGDTITDFTQTECPTRDIPHMTESAYIDHAHDRLSDQTIECLKASTAEAAPGVTWTPEQARAITSALDPTSGAHPLLGFDTCWSSRHGVRESRCIARRQIKSGQLIGFLGGQLMEDSDHKRHPGSNMCLHVPREELGVCDYEGPSLTLCLHERKNFGALIRPPADACEEITPEETAEARAKGGNNTATPVQGNHLVNVKLNFFIDKERGAVFILMVAARRILVGQELLMVRTLGCFLSEEHFQLTMSGRESHHIHACLRELERALAMHRINETGGNGAEDLDHMSHKQQVDLIADLVPEYAPPDEINMQKSQISSGLNFDVPFEMKHAPKIKPCHLTDVFDHAQVTHTRRAFLSKAAAKADPELIKLLARQPDSLPDYLISNNGRKKIFVDKEQLKFVLEHGFDHRLVCVAEDISLHSAVRLFTIPAQPSYGVYAKVDIPLGTWLYVYVALMQKEGTQDATSDYIYSVPPEAVREVLPRWNLPPMMFDAKKFGSTGRLVNDSRYRNIKQHANDESCINVESRWVFWNGMLHFAFYAPKPIRKNQELITVSDTRCTGRASRVIDGADIYSVCGVSSRSRTVSRGKHIDELRATFTALKCFSLLLRHLRRQLLVQVQPGPPDVPRAILQPSAAVSGQAAGDLSKSPRRRTTEATSVQHMRCRWGWSLRLVAHVICLFCSSDRHRDHRCLPAEDHAVHRQGEAAGPERGWTGCAVAATDESGRRGGGR
jgi:hypothetical protein